VGFGKAAEYDSVEYARVGFGTVVSVKYVSTSSGR
jgi:hypothetical protein